MTHRKSPLFLYLIFFLLVACTAHAQESAIEADKVVDSIGVNTHLAYTNTNYYQQYARVIAALKAAGIRHIRDGYYDWPSGNPMYAIHHQVAAAGIGTDFVIPFDSATRASDLKNFQSLAGDMESIEAPNEFDVNGGSNWATELLSFLPTLQQAGSLLNVPVLGPSLVNQTSFSQLGNIGPYLTSNNLHIYFGGRSPGTQGWGSCNSFGHCYGSIAWWLDNANVDAPGIASYVTESGYNQTTTTDTPYVVPDTIAAIYTVQTVFEMMAHGIQRSYLYELMDDPSSPMMGLMTSAIAPKPSYSMIAALIHYLEDPGASFTPGSLQYTLSGSTANVDHLLMQKRDGSFYLALWINAPIYNPANNTTIPVPSQQVTLTLDSGHGVQSNSWINLDGSVTTESQNSPYAFSLTLSPYVSLIRIVPTN
jgi:hypothetical protein